jgi:hypothetical protein
MEKLNLNFLNDLKGIPNIPKMLSKYGEQIKSYADDYVDYTITTTSINDVIKTYSLYLIVPEIGYDYRVVSLDISGLEIVELTYLTLITKQTEVYKIDVKKDLSVLEDKLNFIFGHELFNASMRFLVEQVHIKREYSRD